MDYENILKQINDKKRSRQDRYMTVIHYKHFSVLKSGDVEILVDNDIADDTWNRKWCMDSRGYPTINVRNKLVRMHDYVMAKTYGKRPTGTYVDHINQDKCDNRRINLRFVSPAENSRNIPLRSDNTTGFTGVGKVTSGGYRAYITVNRKQINLGSYRNIEDAALARREAEDRLGFKTRSGKIKKRIEETD